LTDYAWYYNNAAYAVTDLWPEGSANLPQDTAIPDLPAAYDPPTGGQSLRLRVQLEVGAQPLSANSIAFKLQYAQGSASSDCVSGTWQDVDNYNGTLGRPWTYYTGDGLNDGTLLTTTVLSSSNTEEDFYNANATGGTLYNNDNPAATGSFLEYDWDLFDNNASGSTTYYFRLVEDDQAQDTGIILSKYNTCPSLTTQPSTSQEMRHGDFFNNNTQQGFEWAN
jgi:hypothetical protein